MDAVVLVGLRGAGKSTVGARLAIALACPFRDLDRDVEALANEPLAALLARDEPAFRALEARALEGALAVGPVVIATGGGVVLREENRAVLRRALVVWLRASPEVCAARVAQDPRPRPPLAPGGPLAEARALLAARGSLYEEVSRGGLVVDADGSPAEVVARILDALRVRG
jgi:shikimate kinase